MNNMLNKFIKKQIISYMFLLIFVLLLKNFYLICTYSSDYYFVYNS